VRVLLLAGKGGAGTTTVAAATALTAARAGIKTLLLSTDASPLRDVLSLRPGALRSTGRPVAREVPLEVEAGLAVLQAEPSAPAGGSYGDLRRDVSHVLDAAGTQGVEAEDLLRLTGLEDLTFLCSLREQVADGPWDLVVADVAGGDRGMRLLSAPAGLGRALDRLAAPQRRLGLRRLGPGALLARSLARLRRELDAVRGVLQAPASSVRLVMAPERVGLAQARRAFTSLTVQGLVVDGVIANRVLGADAGSRSWVSSRTAAQSGVLAEADEAFAPLRVQRLPDLPVGPVGTDALADLGANLLDGLASSPRHTGRSAALDGMLASADTGARPHVRPAGDGYELVIAAPFAHARDVQLSRDGDELRLGVQGTWRIFDLPPVLRRCVATEAQVGAGRLVVRFRPDPALWPAPSVAGTPPTEGEQ
jgi:arsenite-transporting ATPase